MIVSLIVAMENNNGIGKDNDLLWHLPTDMRFFKQTTTGHCIVTGRKNYESIPPKFRPLKDRTNIVVTRNGNYSEPNIKVAGSIERALEIAKELGETEVFIIGGGQIYKEALEKGLVQKMYITHVDTNLEADTFFPKFDRNLWKTKDSISLPKDDKNPYQAKIVIYEE
ncbi:MAG: dihydrofolate reductase [Crocinitomicaceae bacterium]|nr:dihydrofolate reductase [Crocinitomicaceae bacterium]|tara:strand:+ start:35044 stop:35547 length:504 start_codon:yes stop_codon:yes gene_type:complete